MRPLQFRWTLSNGFEDLASADWGAVSPGHALATDRTGSRIVGFLFNSLSYASVWSRQTGTIQLDTYLQSQGLDLTGWTLLEAQAVSDGGDVVLGLGYRQGAAGQDDIAVAWRVSGLLSAGRSRVRFDCRETGAAFGLPANLMHSTVRVGWVRALPDCSTPWPWAQVMRNSADLAGPPAGRRYGEYKGRL